jgi:hypothetical protein
MSCHRAVKSNTGPAIDEKEEKEEERKMEDHSSRSYTRYACATTIGYQKGAMSKRDLLAINTSRNMMPIIVGKDSQKKHFKIATTDTSY